MESNNKVKNVILAVLVVGLVGMTIAYAALTQTLVINNNQVTVSSKWRVRFNESVTSTAYGTASVSTDAAATNDRALIEGLRATLVKPGDYVTVDFTVQNEGNIAAKGQATTISPVTLTCTPGTNSTITETDAQSFCNNNIEATVKHADGTTNWTSADTLAAVTGSNTVGGTIGGQIKILYKDVETSAISAANGQEIVVSLDPVYLYFEQN